MGEQRDIVAIEHTDDEGRSMETHLSGNARHTTVLATLFEHIVERREDDYDLSEDESQVLMALYSGVSPFEMADFVGLSVDEVEEIYQHLLEVGAVDEVRTRTEVTLNAQGRNMASEAMSEK
jgi:helix-turn-helix protein